MSESPQVLQRTPLFEEHERLGARLVPFAGWEMPVQYEGLIAEHLYVRSAWGLFDVSHMGEVFVRGDDALDFVQWMTSNDARKLKAGQAQYSLLMNEGGGIVDDIIVYAIAPPHNYLVCVNAANTEKDFDHMCRQVRSAPWAHRKVEVVNESRLWAQIAVQGPLAREGVVRALESEQLLELPSFHFAKYEEGVGGQPWYVARTGYTGEDGFEIFLPPTEAQALWRKLMATESNGMKPKAIGLGARDTLRTEMKYPLYGHELSDDTNGFEAGLGWAVKLDKPEFLGQSPLAVAKAKGLTRKLIGFRLLDKGIPRAGYVLFSFDNQEIGKVTSGTMSPTLQEAIGIGYVSVPWSAEGSQFAVQIRGRMVRAEVVKTPFVKTKKG